MQGKKQSLTNIFFFLQGIKSDSEPKDIIADILLMRANLYGLGSDLKIKSFFTFKRCFGINFVILLTWIRIHQILWIRIHIPAIICWEPDKVPYTGRPVEHGRVFLVPCIE